MKKKESGAFFCFSTLSRRCNGRVANVIAFLHSLPSFLPDEALSRPLQRLYSLKSRSVGGGLVVLVVGRLAKCTEHRPISEHKHSNNDT